MSVVAAVREDGLVQSQGADHTGRRQVKHRLDRLLQGHVGILAGEVGVHIHSYRLGFADGIGETDGAFLCQPSRHDVLGNVPRHIGAAAVHLGTILAGQCAAAMGREAAVGVHHQLAARQAGVGLEAALHKATGGIDEDLGVLVRGKVPQGWGNNMAQHLTPQFCQILVRIMLAGEDNGHQPVRYPELIFHRHLRFAVRFQAGDGAGLAGGGKQQSQTMDQHHRQGQTGGSLVAGVAIHDALVTGAELRVLLHSPSDIPALVMGDNFHLVVAAVSGIADGLADNGGNVRQHGRRDFSSHDDLACGGHDLAGHTGGGVTLQTGIQHGIRDGVAQLVGMAFRDRLGSQNNFIFHGSFSPSFLFWRVLWE